MCDLTSKGNRIKLYEDLKNEKLVPDYLVNNAGFGGHGLFFDRNWEDDARMIELNAVALSHLTHLFLQDFIKRDSGKILNVSSTASLMPGPLQNIYFATKAFVSSFSNALTEELKDTNITVTNLMPGATLTEFGIVADTEDTILFKQSFSAESVAIDGYNGMLKGKMNVISALTFSQKIGMFLMKFAPRKVNESCTKTPRKTR